MAVDLQLYIAGGWTDGTGDDAYEVRSPVTGEHIYYGPQGLACRHRPGGRLRQGSCS